MCRAEVNIFPLNESFIQVYPFCSDRYIHFAPIPHSSPTPAGIGQRFLQGLLIFGSNIYKTILSTCELLSQYVSSYWTKIQPSIANIARRKQFSCGPGLSNLKQKTPHSLHAISEMILLFLASVKCPRSYD